MSGPTTSWQTDGETVADFIFLGFKITADGDWTHEIKRHLLLGRKIMTNLDSILKSRDTTLPTKVHLVKAIVFPVVMYGCEIWTIKKAENWRFDAFELWCWKRLLRVPWTARKLNQSILKEISPIFSLEGLMMKLKFSTLATWCKELIHMKRSWCWERLKAGEEGDDRGWDGWMSLSELQELVMGMPGVLQSVGSQRVGPTEGLNWTVLLGLLLCPWSWGIFFWQDQYQNLQVFKSLMWNGRAYVDFKSPLDYS